MARYTPGASAATTVRRNLWQKPATPHEYDDEFESTTLDPAWVYYVNGVLHGSPPSSTAIDIYGAVAETEARMHTHETHTPSWLRVQCSTDNNHMHMLQKTIDRSTCGDDFLVLLRFRFTQDLSASDYESLVMLQLQNAAGTDESWIRVVQKYHGSSGLLVQATTPEGSTSTTTAITNEGTAIQYIAMQCVGNSVFHWCGTSSNFIFVGEQDQGTTFEPTKLMLKFRRTAGDTQILSVDFVRIIPGATFPF